MALSPDLVEIATRQQVLLEGLKQHEVEKFTPFLLQIDSAIRDKLTRDEVTSLSRQRLEALLAEIESALKAIYAGYTVQLTADLADIAQHQAEFEGKALDSVTTADWSATLPTLDRLKAAVEATPLSVHGADGGRLLADVVSDWTAGEIDSVTGSIRKGYFQGNTTQQIVQAIRGTRAKNYADGLLDVTSRNAEAIVRTGVQHVANAARFNVWEQNADLVQGYVWISVLDLKTTVVCFPGSTVVRCVGVLENIFRAEYCGEIVTITTASGKKLEGTPNHPVLTTNGFLALGKLKPREHVVYSMAFDGCEVGSDKNVGVPAALSKLFDSINKPAIAHVQRKRAAATDFYGDGVGMDGEVHIVSPKRHLRSDFKAARLQSFKDKAFRFVHRGASFARSCLSRFLFGRWAPFIQASQICATAPQDAPYPLFTATANGASDFGGAHAGIEKLDGAGGVSDEVNITLTALEGWHCASALQQSGNGGGSDSVQAAEFGSRCASLVREDDVVCVQREFRSCHVFTLGSSLGFYIAGGIVVQNCRSLDGQVFKIGKGPIPPAHWRCRSTTAASLNQDFKFLLAGATRASADGQVKADLNYYGWLKTQSKAFQDQVLGPTRAQLFRDGGLSAQRFADLQLDRKFDPLTLDEMRRLEPLAFASAGLD